MTNRLKILLSVLILTILYSIYYFAVPVFLNTAAKTTMLHKILKQESGFDIELISPKFKMGFLPSIHLKAKKLSMIDSSKKPPLIIEEPSIEIELFPLLLKKVHLLSFYCKSVSADLRIDSKNRFYIGTNLIMQLSESKLNADNAKFNVQSYDIKFTDDKLKKKIKICGEYFIIEEFNSNNIKIATDTKIITKNGTASINAKIKAAFPIKKNMNFDNFTLDGVVVNLNLAEISPYISILTKGKINQISGILNADSDTIHIAQKNNKLVSNIVLNNLYVSLKNIPDKIVFPEKLNIYNEISLSKNNLQIQKSSFLSKDLKFNVQGEILNIFAKNPELNLKTNLLPSRSETIISILPTVKIPNCEFDISAIKKYGFFAKLEGTVKISGTVLKPFFYGTITASEAYINKPIESMPKAIIKLDFKKDRLCINTTVPVNPPEKVFVKGDINLYNPKDVSFNITSTSNVNLNMAQIVLLPLHEMIIFPLGPVPAMSIKGFGNINLTTKGNKTDPHLYGEFKFNNGKVSFNDINCILENGEGSLVFKDTQMIFSTEKAFINSKPVKITGKCDVYGNLDFDTESAQMNLNTLLVMLKTSPMLKDFKKSVKYIEGTSGNIGFKFNLKGQALDMSDFILGKTVNASGNIKLQNNSILVSHCNSRIKNLSGNINFKNSDIFFDLYPLIGNKRPQIKGKIENEKLYTKFNLGGINQTYNDIPIKILSGQIEATGDKVYLRKINGITDSKPFFIDGTINNINKKPNYTVYFHSKTNQLFIDKYLNKNKIYPLITKGDINYTLYIEGTAEDTDLKAIIKLPKDASIYYLGAVIGDTNNPINITIDCNLKNKLLNLKNFQYDKLITSQNNKTYTAPQLFAKGVADISTPDFKLNNFRIKTFVPTDARIFNLLFKKIMIKQGLFEANMILNGSISNLRIQGKLDFNNIDIPFFEMTMHDIKLLFKEKFIDFKTRGDIFSQEFSLSGTMQNKLTLPVIIENADFILKKLDINQLTSKINNFEIQSNMSKIDKETEPVNNFDLKNLIIKRMLVKAESIRIRNITANNLYSKLSIKENGTIDIDNFHFHVAEGSVAGDFKYNITNGQTKLDLKLTDVNANNLTEALLNLSNQLYGSLSGELNITCKGYTYNDWLKTLNGNGGFRVINGKMPKLGSLEYLLKAANLVKSGITGLTLNSLIELVTPLKTGEFESINGSFVLKSGKAEDIQIFSKGKDLSIFIAGEYECLSSFANLQIFGRVSKKISNVLGVVGNTSLNTLFNTIPGINLDSTNKASFIKNINKIPGIELNDKTYRIFNATVKGELNSENYVQSFQWIE